MTKRDKIERRGPWPSVDIMDIAPTNLSYRGGAGRGGAGRGGAGVSGVCVAGESATVIMQFIISHHRHRPRDISRVAEDRAERGRERERGGGGESATGRGHFRSISSHLPPAMDAMYTLQGISI